MQSKAVECYRQARQKTASPRELEAGILLIAAAHLQSVANNNGSAHRHSVTSALAFNCKIWTILITSAMRADQRLPDVVRQSIAELGLFVMSRTAHVLRDAKDPAVADGLTVLIDINRAVAAGLRS